MKLAPSLSLCWLALTAGAFPIPGEEPWPLGTSVVFAYADAFETVLAYDTKGGEALFNYGLERQGFTRIDAQGALSLGNGTASAPLQDQALLELLGGRAEPEFSIEAWLRFPAPAPEAEVRILSYGDNFSLEQKQHALHFELRCGDATGALVLESKQAELASRARHFCATVRGKRAALYLDGKLRAETELELPGGGWVPGPLVFGSGRADTTGWAGRLEGLAIHARALSAADVAQTSSAYGKRVSQRKPARVTRLQARLVARSRVPSVAEIAPYPESIAVFEYEVVRVLAGFYLPKKMRVAHWVILGEKTLQSGSRKVGETYELSVSDFASQRQLENVNLSDTLEFDFDLRLYFDIGAPRLATLK